jgi:3-phosphoshikimate 1-carboxyvinyltransferase
LRTCSHAWAPTFATGDDWIEARAGRALEGRRSTALAIPDAAMTLAVVGAVSRGPDDAHRHCELACQGNRSHRRDGAELASSAQGRGGRRLAYAPAPSRIAPATIDTYDDHRMAMCFSLAAFGGATIRINDPTACARRFPTISPTFARIAARAPTS